jgi:hypothetical protein
MTIDSAPRLLVVTLGTTTGWGSSARELAESCARAGADVRLVASRPRRPVPTFMLTDFSQARAVRRTVWRELDARAADAVIYCSITAALLWPRPGAIWLDSLAAENRPGRHGVWQRVIERRRLATAPLVLTMANSSLDSLAPAHRPPAITVPVPVAVSGPPAPVRDIDVLAYAGDPVKRRLDLVLAAWTRARRDGETLVVTGTEPDPRVMLPGVRFTGRLEPETYRELVRRARVFVAAPRREDFGIAPLEALADGCLLVTTPSPGPYPALALARELDPRLVADDLAPALRIALDDPRPGYAQRAAELLVAFSRGSVDRIVAEDVLPRLLTR